MTYKINNKTEIVFAHEGENNAREIRFDVSGYPDGIIYLELLRYGDSYAYPITLDRDGNEAVWLPDSTATAKRGTGRGQLVVMADDEVVYKSDVFKLINRYSLATTDEVPDGYDSWIQRLEQIATRVTEGVESGKQEITDTKDSAVSEVETKRTEAVSEVESKRTEAVESIGTVSGEALAEINTAKTEAVNTVNSAKNDGINRLNDRIESGKAEINTAKTTALDSIESKKEAVHTELDGYVEAHHDELKGDKGDAYIVTEEDLKEIGDRVEAEYEPNLNALKEEVSHKAEATDLATANRKIKALTDVLNGKELAFETNEYESAKVDVPSGAVADSVLKIGGKSVVSINLLDITNPVIGTDIEYGSDPKTGFVSVTGSAAYGGVNKDLDLNKLKGKSIYLVVDSCNLDSSTQALRIRIDRGSSKGYYTVTPSRLMSNEMVIDDTVTAITFEARANNTASAFSQKATVSAKGLRLVTASNVSAPYEPYFEDIVSSQTDAIQLRGRNLAEPIHPTTTIAGVKFTKIDGGYLVNGTPSGDASLRIDQAVAVDNLHSYDGSYSLSLFDENGNYVDQNVAQAIVMSYPAYQTLASTQAGNPRTLPITTDGAFVLLRIRQTVNNMRLYIQLEQGSPTPYKPYSLTSYPTNLPMQKSAGTAHDEVEYNVTFKNMKSVDLGSLDWVPSTTIDGTKHRFTAPNLAGEIVRVATSNDKGNMVCPKYGIVTNTDTNNKITGIAVAPSGSIYVYDEEYATSSQSAFKSAMQGVILHYEATEGGEDYTTNILHERVGSVDLGTLSWTYDGNNKFITRTNFGQIGSKNYISDLYYYSSTIWGTSGDTGTSAFGSSREFHARHNSYTDATAFKNAMNGVMLNYELATERIKELPNLPSLEAINVEAGGEISFIDHSDMSFAIPSTHEWVVRNSEV